MRLFTFESPFVCLVLLFASASCELRICPLDQDREAMRIIDSEIMPIFHGQRLSMPASCPFHSSWDRMQVARQSRQLSQGRVRCAFCQRETTTLEQMSEHLMTHSDKISAESTRCFSDYCTILGCFGGRSSEKEWKLLLHRCRQIVSQCVPDRSSVVNALLLSSLCAKFGGVAVEKQDGKVVQILGIVFVGLIVVVFYVVVCMWRKESSFSDEMPRASWWTRAAKSKQS
jgi:hypothetical protein